MAEYDCVSLLECGHLNELILRRALYKEKMKTLKFYIIKYSLLNNSL